MWGLLIEQSDRPYQLLPLAESLGARPLSPDGSTSEGFVNSEAFIKAARFYGDLFNAEKVSPVGILDAPVVREYFGSGKAAMMLGAEWNISRLAEFEGFNFGLSAHPAFEGGRAVTPTGGWHVGISSRIPSDKLDAALHFARYMTSREASAAWARLFGNAPARRDAYEALPDLFSTTCGRCCSRHGAHGLAASVTLPTSSSRPLRTRSTPSTQLIRPGTNEAARPRQGTAIPLDEQAPTPAQPSARGSPQYNGRRAGGASTHRNP